MSYILNISEAILSIKADCKFAVRGENKSTKQETLDACEIEWVGGTPEISKEDIQTKMDELQTEYDALDYARKRKAEYPSVQDLVVALYDTNDKAAIDAKRADIKLKYPKP